MAQPKKVIFETEKKSPTPKLFAIGTMIIGMLIIWQMAVYSKDAVLLMDNSIALNLENAKSAQMASSISMTEGLITQSALFHSNKFTPEKRIALYKALADKTNGYEKRLVDMLAVNESDEATHMNVRNDFMTGFMSARPEAAQKQETLVNLFDLLDDSVKTKYHADKKIGELEKERKEIERKMRFSVNATMWMGLALMLVFGIRNWKE